jgi:hypothetical protein
MADDLPVEPFDAADAIAENNARRDIERLQREDLDVLRAIMHTKKGRAWIIRQLDRCHINSPAKFVPGSADVTARNLGLEAYGIWLLQDVMKASVDLYMTAIKEAQEAAERANAVRREAALKRKAEERGPSAEDMAGVKLPPPAGFPGHVPPTPIAPKGRGK